MRVPIYPADLADSRGFKKIAKKIKRNWPNSTPLKLSAAFEILSRGLGYRNYNEVLMCTNTCPLNTTVPTLAEARDGINTSIFVYLRTKCAYRLDWSALDPLVMLLPLQDLQAFKGSNSTQRTRQPETPVLMPLPPFTQTEHGIGPLENDNGQEVASSGPHIHCSHHSKSTRVMSREELVSLKRVLQQKDNLRDQALFALLLSGLRPIEIVEVKVADFNSPSTSISWLAKKTRTAGKRLKSCAASDLVGRYIQGVGLSDGDYLFPLKNDPRIPMSDRELRKIFHSWLVAAQIERTRTSIHSVRLTVAAFAGMAETPTLRNLFDHQSPDILRFYTRPLDKGADL